MSPESDQPSDAGELRRRAEEIFRGKTAPLPENLKDLSPKETRRVLHELRVHQIELEMQNEELRESYAERDASRARFFDFYDLAPVGYFTVSEQGLILEANFTACAFLDVVRGAMVARSISHFILKDDQDIYYLYNQQLFETHSASSGLAGGPQACELRMVKSDRTVFWVHLEAIIVDAADGAPVCRVVMNDITGRKKVEERLRENEERLRVIFEASPDAYLIMEVNDRGRISDCNAAAEAMLRGPKSQILGKTPDEVSPEHQPDGQLSSEAAEARIRYCRIHGKHDFEWVHRRMDGEDFWAHVTLSVITLEGRQVLLACLRDITNRKRVEEALVFSKKKLELALKSSQMGVWQFNIVESKRTFDNQVCQLLGIDPATFRGTTEEFFALVHPDDRERIKEALKKTMEHNVPYAPEYRAVWPDGSIHDICGRGELIRDDKGNPSLINGILWDVTERKQMSEALREATDRLSLAVRAGGVGLWDYDVVQNKLVWDDQMYLLYGIKKDKFGGAYEAWQTGVHPEDRQRSDEELQKALRGEKDFDIEFRVLWPDATIRSLRAFALVQRDAFGKPTHMIGTNWDITAQKQLAEDLKRESLEVEKQAWGIQKANDGIKTLYHELEKKNQELAKMDRLKNNFVSLVSHELRNPLGVVREAVVLILDGLASPVVEAQRPYLAMIKKTSERLIRVTTDLLDLAKIEAGKIVLNFENIDFLFLVKQSFEGTVRRAHNKGLTTLEDFPSEERLEISGDFDKLLQVMVNLLNNAFKFTEKGGITVEVRDLGEEVRCAVIDTGQGVSKEDLSDLFNKFEQFGKPSVSEEKGSGLGLVISQSIIEGHGGRMGFESELGKGSTVFFTLPKKQKQKLGAILLDKKVLPPE
ncbi:MAG: PAS domain-containing protein [Candidatus Omnitrophota bacterium]